MRERITKNVQQLNYTLFLLVSSFRKSPVQLWDRGVPPALANKILEALVNKILNILTIQGSKI